MIPLKITLNLQCNSERIDHFILLIFLSKDWHDILLFTFYFTSLSKIDSFSICSVIPDIFYFSSIFLFNVCFYVISLLLCFLLLYFGDLFKSLQIAFLIFPLDISAFYYDRLACIRLTCPFKNKFKAVKKFKIQFFQARIM